MAVPPVRHEEGYGPNARLYKWKHPHGRRSDCPADAGSSELVGVGFNVTYFYPRDYWDWVGIEWDLII